MLKNKTSILMNGGGIVSLSACWTRADSGEGAYITVQATPGVAHRRVLYDTEARRSQRDIV